MLAFQTPEDSNKNAQLKAWATVVGIFIFILITVNIYVGLFSATLFIYIYNFSKMDLYPMLQVHLSAN